MLKLPDGTVKVLVEGVQRGIEIWQLATAASSLHRRRRARADVDGTRSASSRCVALGVSQFEQYVKLNKKVPPEVLTSLSGIEDAGRLADTIAAHMPLKLERQAEGPRDPRRAAAPRAPPGRHRGRDRRAAGREAHPRPRQAQMEKSQREYYLNEQMKAIQKELGEMRGRRQRGLDELEKKIKKAGMTKEAKDKARPS
jgi:ATP-dependent Lon protease